MRVYVSWEEFDQIVNTRRDAQGRVLFSWGLARTLSSEQRERIRQAERAKVAIEIVPTSALPAERVAE